MLPGPNDSVWLALALVLMLGGAAWTWYAFARRGLASGVRGLGLTLLPLAAVLTGALRLLVEVAEAVLRWAGGLAFSPVVWLGVGVAGVAVVLFLVAGLLGGRAEQRDPRPAGVSGRGASASGSGRGTDRSSDTNRGRDSDHASAGGEESGGELDEVEEILRRRGIT